MVQFTKDHITTPADRLRQLIDEAEIAVANLKGSGEEAEKLLPILDDIDQEFNALRQTGLDLRSEEGRIAGLYGSLRKRKSILLRELRPSGGLAHMREDHRPTEDQWWWFLDHELAQERKRAMIRYGKVALVSVIVLIVSIIVYRKFFSPDPLVMATYENLNMAIDHMMMGQYEEAIPYFENNLELAPLEAEWPIRLGVLEEIAGSPIRSVELFDRGRELSSNEAEFLLQRADSYSQVNHFEAALVDAQRVTELDPTLPMGFFLLGRSYSSLGQRPEMMAAYEKVIELTETTKGYEALYVLVKMELAQLYQSPQIDSGVPAATATP